MYQHILVPLDGSSFGEYALPMALAIAHQAHATIQLIHVIPPPPTILAEEPPLGDADAEERTHVSEYLNTLATSLSQRWEVPIDVTVCTGIIAEQLTEYARNSPTDLVVMTTHGRGPLSRLFLGSVARELIRTLTVPVLLIRPSELPIDLLETVHEQPFQRVVIPLDGSALAEEALEPAIALGTAMNAEYVLLRALDPPALAYNLTIYNSALITQEQDEAHAYLEATAQALRARGLRVKTVVMIGEPAVSILGYLHKHGGDVLAMTTHGRSGVPAFLFGSVAEQVVHSAGVAVLLQRSQSSTHAFTETTHEEVVS